MSLRASEVAEERLRAKRAREEMEKDPILELMTSQPRDLDDFDAMLNEAPSADDSRIFLSLKVPENVNAAEMKPAYLIVDGVNKIKQMCQILSFHYHVINGEPMTELYYNTELNQFDELETPIYHT